LALSMPNGSGCGASTFDVYTGFSADSGAASAGSVDLTNAAAPALTVTGSGANFNYFWGFVDHNCGGLSGAAANSFSYAYGSTGVITLIDTVTDPYVNGSPVGHPVDYTVGTLTLSKVVGSTLTLIQPTVTSFTFQDYTNLPDISGTVTGFDLQFTTPIDPQVQLSLSLTLPGAQSPQSFSSVPEPGSLFLVGSGIVGLAIWRRGRRT
jgi:hypothetical protein